MEQTATFRSYSGRFVRLLFKEAVPWARDNIVFAAALFFLPLFAVYLRDRGHQFDWDVATTTLWLYLSAFGIYATYHMVRTAWRLDVQRNNDLQETRRAAVELEGQINE